MTQIATPQAIEKQLNDSGYHTTDWDAEIIQYHNHNMYVLWIIIYGGFFKSLFSWTTYDFNIFAYKTKLN